MSGFLVNKSLLDPTVTQYSGGTTSFTLPQSGSTNSTEVFVGGVPQVAGVDFNIAGTALTLTTSAPAGANMVCARQYFSDGITGTAGANTVATSAIQNDSVTGGKLNPALVAGDLIYADGTDTINRLAKGSALQTLQMNAGATAPNWVTAASAGWEFVESATASTSSTIVLGEGNIAAGYNYQIDSIQVDNSVDLTGANSPIIQYGTSTGPTYQTSGYINQLGTYHAGNYAYGAQSRTTAGIPISSGDIGWLGGATAGETWDSTVTISNPAAVTEHRCYGISIGHAYDGSEALHQHGGHRTTAEAITGFRLQPGTGTFITGLFILSRRKIA
tara:strand:+ start:359 stop:1351 length:993 start_codon:yes stop_codon:yes gene_type:complete